VSELDGVGRRMPFTMGAFALASLGLAGLPLMGGFLSKWHLVLGAFEGGSTWAALVMTGAGLLTAGYLFPVVHRAFFRPGPRAAVPVASGTAQARPARGCTPGGARESRTSTCASTRTSTRTCVHGVTRTLAWSCHW
jgi:formate hydrogenlyase subunit 3/multisubunit Na+/H+ antiporter MnhD subunit